MNEWTRAKTISESHERTKCLACIMGVKARLAPCPKVSDRNASLECATIGAVARRGVEGQAEESREDRDRRAREDDGRMVLCQCLRLRPAACRAAVSVSSSGSPAV